MEASEGRDAALEPETAPVGGRVEHQAEVDNLSSLIAQQAVEAAKVIPEHPSMKLLFEEIARAAAKLEIEMDELLPKLQRDKINQLVNKIVAVDEGEVISQSDGTVDPIVLVRRVYKQVCDDSGLRISIAPASKKKGWYATIYVTEKAGDKVLPKKFRIVIAHLALGDKPLVHKHKSPDPEVPGEVTVLIAGGPFGYTDPSTRAPKELVLDPSAPEKVLRIEPGDTIDGYLKPQTNSSRIAYSTFQDADEVDDDEYDKWESAVAA